MKTTLKGYSVHTVHDTEVEIDSVVADGRHKGRAGKLRLPGLIVEAVSSEGDPVLTFKVVCDTPEDHAKALKAYGFGAMLEVDVRSVGEGRTPREQRQAALHHHIAEAEAQLPDLEAAYAGLPANLDQGKRDIEKDRLQAHRDAIKQQRKTLADLVGDEDCGKLIADAHSARAAAAGIAKS